MDEREKNLPKWAQELIASLRRRVESGNEPLLREVARLRPLNEKLKSENEAYREFLDCAARGKHMTAQAIVDVLDECGIGKKGE